MTIFNRNENEASSEAKSIRTKTPGARILEARKRKGLTQDDFAKLLNVTAQAVSKWENDASCPDIMLLPKISEILGISLDELLTGEARTDTKKQIPVTDNSKNKLHIKISPLNKKPTNITVPVALVKRIAKIGNGISGIIGNASITDSQLEEILALTQEGVTGELLNIEADDGTVITIEICQ